MRGLTHNFDGYLSVLILRVYNGKGNAVLMQDRNIRCQRRAGMCGQIDMTDTRFGEGRLHPL